MSRYELFLILAFVLDYSTSNILDGKLAMLFSVSTVPPFFNVEKRVVKGKMESVEFVTDDYQDIFFTSTTPPGATLDDDEENFGGEGSQEDVAVANPINRYINYENPLYKDMIYLNAMNKATSMVTTTTTSKPTTEYIPFPPIVRYPAGRLY